MKILFAVIVAFSVVATLIPLIAYKKWWIRGFDFPHLQITVLTLISGVGFAYYNDLNNWLVIAFLVVISTVFIYQLKIIYPYTPFSPKQVASTQCDHKESRIRILAFNVMQDNRDFERFEKVFQGCVPDIAVFLETDDWWWKKLKTFDAYPYHISHPLDNYYGIVLLSKFPLKDTEVKFLIDDDIPSIHAKIQLKNGKWVRLYCLHPMPPSPTENEDSLDRDAELLLVAKKVKDLDEPVIVLGDLNDVAWSHTTRLFPRISRLLDPRIGRGVYNTFHVNYPFFRWPLDHMFVSKDFQLVQIERLSSGGSDHFPMFAELCHDCYPPENNTPEKASTDDKKEADKTVDEGKS